jgi:hypothetical protein
MSVWQIVENIRFQGSFIGVGSIGQTLTDPMCWDLIELRVVYFSTSLPSVSI